MNYLHLALHGLRHAVPEAQESVHNYFREQQIEAVEGTVTICSAIAAASGVGAGWIPGAGGIIAAGAMTATVWTMYVKINKDLGISIGKNLLKFIASAFVTNLVLNVGSIIGMYAATAIVSFIPGFGSVPAALIDGILGFVITYASAILYINLLTKIMKAKGSLDNVTSESELKVAIDEVKKEADIKGIVREARDAYKEAKRNGDIDKAKSSKNNKE